MKKDLNSMLLTRQELQIMKVVWERGEATVKDVCDVISQTKKTAYTTILTLMSILEEKGALAHMKMGRAYVYKPLLARDQATRNHVTDVITRFFDGEAERLIEHLLDTGLTQPHQLGYLKNRAEARHQFA